MSARYEVERAIDGTSYNFKTSSGITYFAYFTEFVLLDSIEQELNIVSFGFTCDRMEAVKRYDTKVKQTIIHIIEGFFASQPDNAVLYMCMDNDGKSRNRHITFGCWFREIESDLEKHNFTAKDPKAGFYSSLLLKSSNPEKERLIDAFYFTIHHWGL